LGGFLRFTFEAGISVAENVRISLFGPGPLLHAMSDFVGEKKNSNVAARIIGAGRKNNVSP
jgi:hypothetical protein